MLRETTNLNLFSITRVRFDAVELSATEEDYPIRYGKRTDGLMAAA